LYHFLVLGQSDSVESLYKTCAIPMSWILLALLSALFLGFYDVAKKASVNHNAVLVVLFACSASGLLLLLPLGVISCVSPALADAWGIRIHTLSLVEHGLILAKAGLVTVSWVLTYFALKHLPISLAAPVRASAPLFTLLGAILVFGEAPSPKQWLGMGIILLAYFAFSLIGRREGIHFSRNLWVWFLFLGTLVGAASGLYDKHLLQSVALPPLDVQFWFTVYNSLLQGMLVLFIWFPRRQRTTPFQFRYSIFAVGILLLAADALYFQALANPHALVSVVSTLRRSNVVISFTFGSLAFGETQRFKKAIALAGVLLGITLLLAER
jgi:drug/metabolite transporter (DMT)-like permease